MTYRQFLFFMTFYTLLIKDIKISQNSYAYLITLIWEIIMKKIKMLKGTWFYIFIGTFLIYCIVFLNQLSFINLTFQFCFKVCLFLLFIISISKLLFNNMQSMKIFLFFLCMLFIILNFLHYSLLKDSYITIIDLNNRKIAVQEHFILHDYSVNFYKVKYKILKTPLKNKAYLCLDYPSFHIGDYKVTDITQTTATIEYMNPKYSYHQIVIIDN